MRKRARTFLQYVDVFLLVLLSTGWCSYNIVDWKLCCRMKESWSGSMCISPEYIAHMKQKCQEKTPKDIKRQQNREKIINRLSLLLTLLQHSLITFLKLFLTAMHSCKMCIRCLFRYGKMLKTIVSEQISCARTNFWMVDRIQKLLR